MRVHATRWFKHQHRSQVAYTLTELGVNAIHAVPTMENMKNEYVQVTLMQEAVDKCGHCRLQIRLSVDSARQLSEQLRTMADSCDTTKAT